MQRLTRLSTAGALLTTAERCPRTKSSLAPCTLCQTVCPTDSVRIERGSLTIDSRCTGCGGCHAVCPTGALRPQRPSDVTLADRALAQPPPFFGCARAVPAEGAVWVRCLARISAAMLFRLSRKGARSVRLLAGKCDRCPDFKALSGALEWSVAAYKELCAAAGLPEVVITRERRPARDELPAGALSRRELFSALLPPSDIERGSASPLRAELRSATALRGAYRLSHAPVGVPVVEGECDACGLCGRLCPTGALEGIRNGEYCLVRRAGRCVACGTCESVCATGALRVLRELEPADTGLGCTETLVEVRLTACQECGAPVATGVDLCAGCGRRRPIGDGSDRSSDANPCSLEEER